MNTTTRRGLRRRGARELLTIAIIGATALTLAGCTGGTPVHDETATTLPKDAVVTVVDDTADAVGGTWSVASGPAVEACDREGGGRGAAYSYTTMREQHAGDPAQDVDAVEQLWKQQGITTERYQSGSSTPTLGIRGVGGPTKSIDFLADTRGYSLDAVSTCAAGDAEELQRNGE